MKEKKYKIIFMMICILLAIISFFVLGSILSNPENYKGIIASLDNKREAVLAMTASSTGLSAVLSVVPGDALTPIAEKLADLSTYFLVILCAISLEKLLLGAIGFLSFRILIPLTCIITAGALLLETKGMNCIAVKAACRKVMIFAIIIEFVIPVSVWTSQVIESVNKIDYSAEVSETTEDSKETKKETKKASGISGFVNGIKDTITGLGDTISNADITEIKEQAIEGLNKLLDSIATLIVTCCVIPILVIFLFYWITKIIFNVVPDSKAIRNLEKYIKKEERNI